MYRYIYIQTVGPLDGVDLAPVTLPKVSCGAHTAPDCSKCPQGNGPAPRKVSKL